MIMNRFSNEGKYFLVLMRDSNGRQKDCYVYCEHDVMNGGFAPDQFMTREQAEVTARRLRKFCKEKRLSYTFEIEDWSFLREIEEDEFLGQL